MAFEAAGARCTAVHHPWSGANLYWDVVNNLEDLSLFAGFGLAGLERQNASRLFSVRARSENL